MLSITRAEGSLEVAIDETRRLSLAIDEIDGAMLCAELASCGRLRHALVLTGGSAWSPIRIEAAPGELGLIHQYVIESMIAAASGPRLV